MGQRIACQIVGAGLIAGVMCSLRIEGMTQAQMNALSKLQASIIMQSNSSVTVMARSGGTSAAWQTVFVGGITEAFADFSGSPSVAFMVTAMSMATINTAPVKAISFSGDVAVADVMKAIATQAGLGFQNNGVTDVLKGGVTYNGTAGEQLEVAASATKTSYIISNNILTIWPRNLSAKGTPAAEISASTGMIGYPAYSQGGMTLATLFNGLIGFQSLIKLTSDYAPAAWTQSASRNGEQTTGIVLPPYNGLWRVVRVQHDLQSETPGGQWTTYIEAGRPEIVQETIYGQ
ncbi:hypothetical protein HKD30_07055 [Gluconobacter sphaericus]|nr:hypothetical protein [Gluconobacter sphaericus]